MNLRTVVRSALALLTALVAVAVPQAGAPSASATGTTVHATTESWSFIRRACRTFTAGTVCVNLEGNGQPSTYRVVYELQPKPGQWMRMLSTATWRVGGRLGIGATTAYHPFCSGAGCPRVYAPTNFVVSSPFYAVYTVIADTPSGHVEVSAGATPLTVEGFIGCGAAPSVAAFLTSTADGTVYLARSGTAHEYDHEFTMSDLTPARSNVFFTHKASRPFPPENYRSRTFYASWQRFPSGSEWVTQETYSTADGNNSYESEPIC